MEDLHSQADASLRTRRRFRRPLSLLWSYAPFQQPERVVGFFNTYRQLYPVSRQTLRGIAEQFQQWLKGWAGKRSIPIVDAPEGRRDDFVDPYFSRQT